MKLMDFIRGCRKAHWNVFNKFQVAEFAECSRCGYEVEPDFTFYPHAIYPPRCPNCKSRMTHSEA